MWSLGCVIYTLLTGRTPFESMDNHNIFYRIVAGKFDIPALYAAGVQSRHCADFLRRLLEPNPVARMMEYEALRHPWLTESSEDGVYIRSMEVYPECLADDEKLDDYRDDRIDSQDIGEDWHTVNQTRRGLFVKKEEEENVYSPPGVHATRDQYLKMEHQEDEDDFDIIDKDDKCFKYEPAGSSFNDAPEFPGLSHDSAKASNGALGLQSYEFVSEQGNQSLNNPEIQVESSQFSEVPELPQSSQSPGSLVEADADSELLAEHAGHKKQKINRLGVAKPLIGETADAGEASTSLLASSFPSSQRGHGPHIQEEEGDERQSEHPNGFEHGGFGELGSFNDTKVMSSASSSINYPPPDPTVSQAQMPPPVVAPSGTPTGPHIRKPITPMSRDPKDFDYDNCDLVVPPGAWGKLVPLQDSIEHPSVLLLHPMVIFGRGNNLLDYPIYYTDERLSKAHCAIHIPYPRPPLEGEPPLPPFAWFHSSATNSPFINGEQFVERDEEGKKIKKHPMKVYEGDIIDFFQGGRNKEKLSFVLCLRPDPLEWKAKYEKENGVIKQSPMDQEEARSSQGSADGSVGRRGSPRIEVVSSQGSQKYHSQVQVPSSQG